MPPLSALGMGCRVPMPGPGAPGSIPTADEDHQELPRGSRSELASPQPDTTTRPSYKWGLLQPGGSHPRGTVGVPAGGHRGAWEARAGAGALGKGYRGPDLALGWRRSGNGAMLCLGISYFYTRRGGH